MYQSLLQVLEENTGLLETLFGYLVQHHPEEYQQSVEKMRQEIRKVTHQDGTEIVCELQQDKKQKALARKLAMLKRFNQQQEDFSEKHDPVEEAQNSEVQGGTCMLCQSNMAGSDDLMGVMAHFQLDNLSEYYYFSQT